MLWTTLNGDNNLRIERIPPVETQRTWSSARNGLKLEKLLERLNELTPLDPYKQLAEQY